jgi:uncharacterized protein (TIGR02246 family)
VTPSDPNRRRGARARPAVLLACLSILAPVAGAAATDSAEAVIARELGVLLETQAAAWSRGDLDAFASVYAEDALFLSPSGTTRGRAELVERYRGRYPDAAAMGRLTLEVLEARAGSDTAGVAARWTLSYSDRPEATGLTLLVFRRTAEGWQIVQDASF